MKKKDRGFNNIESFVAAGVEIKGEITSPGSMRIEGYVEGNLSLDGDLILGEKGKILGEVKAKNMMIAGRTEGKVRADERLEIAGTGTIIGEIQASILVIDEGGVLDGISRMTRSQGEKSDFEQRLGLRKEKAKA